MSTSVDNCRPLDKLAEDHPIVTTLVVLWYAAHVSFATFVIFWWPSTVSMAIATCYGALVGIPSVCVTVYQWKMQVNVVTGSGTYHDHSSEETG